MVAQPHCLQCTMTCVSSGAGDPSPSVVDCTRPGWGIYACILPHRTIHIAAPHFARTACSCAVANKHGALCGIVAARCNCWHRSKLARRSCAGAGGGGGTVTTAPAPPVGAACTPSELEGVSTAANKSDAVMALMGKNAPCGDCIAQCGSVASCAMACVFGGPGPSAPAVSASPDTPRSADCPAGKCGDPPHGTPT